MSGSHVDSNQQAFAMAFGNGSSYDKRSNNVNSLNLRKIFEDDMGKNSSGVFPQMPVQKALYLDEIERQ
jgi:hypothetical protein